MVGRADELALLEEAFGRALEHGHCAHVAVLGAAGVGKSRLVRELLDRLDARVIEGRCLSYGDGITYRPVVELVKQLEGAESGLLADAPVARDTIRALLGQIELPTTPDEIAWAVRRLLEQAAARRPLVVILDDVHWGEPAFLDLVEHVVERAAGGPLLLVSIARPELLELRPDFAGEAADGSTIRLEPLDLDESSELMERLLAGRPLETGLHERIRAAAAGNPLFLEEMLAMVGDSGEREVIVPPTIQALLAARLDQLDQGERTVLECGSVEGQLFHDSAVEALAGDPAAVSEQLDALVRKELVRPDRPQLPARAAFRFRHLLIRDAAYDALPKADRAVLHERFAGWLEERGRDLVELDEIVGYHLEQAARYRTELGLDDEATAAIASRAAQHLGQAGTAARFRGDYTAALTLLERAAALDAGGRLSLLPDLAELRFELGDLLGAAELLDEAVELGRATGDRRVEALATVLRADLTQSFGAEPEPMAAVIELAYAAAATLEQLGAERELPRVLVVAGNHLGATGRFAEAAAAYERALRYTLERGDRFLGTLCLVRLLGAKALGPATIEENLRLHEGIPAELAAAMARLPATHIHSAVIAGYAGRFAEARAHHAEARRLLWEQGLTIRSASTAMFDGGTELLAGDPGAAERLLRTGWDRLGELGETGMRATIGSLLATALVALGRHGEAEDALDAADAMARPDDVDVHIRSGSVRARILANRGEHGAAEQTALEAVELAAGTDCLNAQGEALLALAEVLRTAGATAESSAAFGEALDRFERKGNIAQAGQTRALLAAWSPPR